MDPFTDSEICGSKQERRDAPALFIGLNAGSLFVRHVHGLPPPAVWVLWLLALAAAVHIAVCVLVWRLLKA